MNRDNSTKKIGSYCLIHGNNSHVAECRSVDAFVSAAHAVREPHLDTWRWMYEVVQRSIPLGSFFLKQIIIPLPDNLDHCSSAACTKSFVRRTLAGCFAWTTGPYWLLYVDLMAHGSRVSEFLTDTVTSFF